MTSAIACYYKVLNRQVKRLCAYIQSFHGWWILSSLSFNTSLPAAEEVQQWENYFPSFSVKLGKFGITTLSKASGSSLVLHFPAKSLNHSNLSPRVLMKLKTAN